MIILISMVVWSMYKFELKVQVLVSNVFLYSGQILMTKLGLEGGHEDILFYNKATFILSTLFRQQSKTNFTTYYNGGKART
mmetsp:Transcript_5857/g.8782  ORF Transcript_5857/g.8782 Transcript_5857/m.8782 type:complete len:81 (-) Transcript_5857:71-313(-)